MSQKTPLARWHQAIKTGDASILSEILAEEVVFHSPVVWTPQKGKMITTLYLMGAFQVLGGQDFVYVKEIIAGNTAILEFNTKIEDIVVNGVDIIQWNEAGKIIEFKVMVRPLKGMHIVHQKMATMLEQIKPG